MDAPTDNRPIVVRAAIDKVQEEWYTLDRCQYRRL